MKQQHKQPAKLQRLAAAAQQQGMAAAALAEA
jgi:hypothetical protein